MRQESASQVQTALDASMELMLQMLGDDLSQHNLLRKILRSHAERRFPSRPGATAQSQQRNYAGESFRSSHPNPPSARSAIRAAGIAPARICAVSTEAD